MEKQEWIKINQIVDTALDLDQQERSSYIEEECKNEDSLKKQVVELLDSIEESKTEQFLEGTQAYPHTLARNLSASDQNKSTSSMIGQIVGRYEITELIGHGGMGSVFKAKRTDGVYDKPVAIKILQRGMDTPSNIARFERERNILANLDHPHIARLLDGGLTDQGLPYLVMEYVNGVPLLSYCNHHQLTVTERLELFENVCAAVNHAHQNAVIHRDLKPSNILVTEKGVVKVLDFGIAKLINPSRSENIFKTRTGARMLTLGYAAPEQIEAQAITTATDAYVLGVLLYELLVGHHPFDLEKKGLTEIEQIVRKKPAEKPSGKFATLSNKQQKQVAKARQTTPSKLLALLKGDLDAIVQKALRKEPKARYTSPEKLLDDLSRRDDNLPVIAREDTVRYNISKFIKRYRKGLTAAAVFLLVIVSIVSFYTIQLSEERNQAKIEAQRSEAVTGFLTDLIQSNYPENAQGDTITVRQFLDEGYQKVQDLEQTPLVKAEIMKVMGHTYRTLGQTQKAKTMVTSAVELLESHHALPVERANTYNTAGLISRDLGQPKQAASHLRSAVTLFEVAEKTETAQYAKALRDLAYVEKQLGEFSKAQKNVTKAIAIDKLVNGQESAELAESFYIYASLLRNQKKYSKALEFQKKSFSILEENIKGPHPGKSANLNNLAILYKETGNNQKAITSYRKSFQINKELYGEKHFRVTNNATNIAKLYTKEGQLDSALTYNKFALKTAQKILSPGHPQMARILHNHAKIFIQKDDFIKSDSLHRKAIEVINESDNNDAPHRGNIYLSWAENALQQQQPELALQYYNKSYQSRKNNFGLADPLTQIALNNLIELLRETDYTQKADSLSQYTKSR